MAKQIETVFAKLAPLGPEDVRNLEESLRTITGNEPFVAEYTDRKGKMFYVLVDSDILPKLVRSKNGEAFYQLRSKLRRYIDPREELEEVRRGTLFQFPEKYLRRAA